MIDFKPFITYKDLQRPSVSNWNVGEHIMHCCLATQAFEKALNDSEPGAKSPSFHPAKFIVLSFGIIPRGKGQAPESVIPEKEYRDEELFQATEEAMASEKRMMAYRSKSMVRAPCLWSFKHQAGYKVFECSQSSSLENHSRHQELISGFFIPVTYRVEI